jgi:leucyl/phenylalanyl-tRNA--protein transferase
VVPWLSPGDPFPPVERALRDPNGLLAAGMELSSQRLIDAYSRGIFPWFNEDDPVLWWSPDPRMVLFTNELRVSRSLRKVLRAGGFTVTFDAAFEDVMRGCAEPRAGQEGTWISDVMLEAYTTLADAGLAHSVEVWSGRSLVGGLYGVAVGKMFFGESMFSRTSNASKVGLTTLVRQLERWGFEVIDCQMSTGHLASLGAREISRPAFVALVERLSAEPAIPAPWRADADLSGSA